MAFRWAETEALHDARTKAFDQNVGASHDVQHALRRTVGTEVDLKRSTPAIEYIVEWSRPKARPHDTEHFCAHVRA
jgi:hypothetical protein